MSEGRKVWVKVRASRTERAEWHAKAAGAGLSLSDLVRRSMGRVRTWTAAHAALGYRPPAPAPVLNSASQPQVVM